MCSLTGVVSVSVYTEDAIARTIVVRERWYDNVFYFR